MAVKIRNMVSSDVMPCSLVDSYKHRKVLYIDDGDTMFHQNTGIYLPDYTLTFQEMSY
jgi:hypothetical protein